MGVKTASNVEPKVCTANTTLLEYELENYDVIRCDTSAIRLDLPAITVDNLDVTIWNASSGFVFLSGASTSMTFISGDANVAIPPYTAVRLGTCVGSTSSAGVRTYNYYTDQETKDIVGTWTITDDDTWTTGTPGSIVATGRYLVKEGVMFFSGRIYSADGNGATALVIEHIPGFPPQAVSMKVPYEAQQLVDTTYSDAKGYVDAAQSAAADMQFEFDSLSTATDAKALEILIQGWYPLWGFTAYTPTVTSGTKTPATNVATTGYYKEICDGRVGLFCTYYTADDSDGMDGCTVTIPWRLQDADTYIAVKSTEQAGAAGATLYNPFGYIDQAHATAENRGKVQYHNWTSATDDKAVKVWNAGIVELAGWTSVTATQISQTFTTGTPGNITKKFRFFADGAICFYSYYWTSADGNGATALTTESIAPPRYLANHKQAAIGNHLQNATYYNPNAYWESNTTDPDDCELIQNNLQTCTDAQSCSMEVAGFIFI